MFPKLDNTGYQSHIIAKIMRFYSLVSNTLLITGREASSRERKDWYQRGAVESGAGKDGGGD